MLSLLLFLGAEVYSNWVAQLQTRLKPHRKLRDRFGPAKSSAEARVVRLLTEPRHGQHEAWGSAPS